MSLVVMGASYKTAPIALRERIGVSSDEIASVLSELVSQDSIREALVLSTCNRVEVYIDAKTDRLGAIACTELLSERAGDLYAPDAFYLHRGAETVRHLFRVVCSLDSQVLGEAQILGQVKRSFADSMQADACGDVLAKLFKMAIQLGKRARTETGIGSDSVSLSTTAFKAAVQSVDDIQSSNVVLIGAGQMAQLALTYLRDAGVSDICVISRSFEHAMQTAQKFGAGVAAFPERYAAIAQADVVFTMTHSPTPVIEASKLASVMEAHERGKRPLVIIDEAVPRDVDFACSDIDGVELFDQERLTSIVDDGLAKRMKSVSDVERMADEAEREFLAWLQERLVVPTVKEMYEKGEIVVSEELLKAAKEFSKLHEGELEEDELSVLAAYGNAIMKKLLHGPVMRLHREATSPDSYYYTGAARYLFGLDVFPPDKRRPCTSHECETGRCPIGLERDLQPFCRAMGDA